MAGLKVNFSEQEASSEAFDFEALPSGKYPVTITDIETRESNSEKNKGKPYWHLELTVDEGHPNAGRKLWANVMLFDGALYSLAQLLKATGNEDAIKSGKVPDADYFVSKQVVVTVAKQRDTYRENKQEEAGERSESDPPLYKNEVKGFKPGAAAGSPVATGKASVLP
jgi:hypothetical protein